ncbi:hypothetical protein GCM10017673_39020 [Streptosporangium violaceochromogenes]|nr:hypothetical protein GCM10017673_39020 [Streptosporangium violaceochromogenes]
MDPVTAEGTAPGDRLARPAVRRFSPRRYACIARKYWRANPRRAWWVLHVWDEILRDLHTPKNQPTADNDPVGRVEAAPPGPADGLPCVPDGFPRRENTAEALRGELAAVLRRDLRLRLGSNALAQARRGEPIALSGREADIVADAVLAVAAPHIAAQARRDVAERALNGGLPVDMDECRIMARYRRQGRQDAGAEIADLIEHVIGEYPGNGIPRPVNDQGQLLIDFEWAAWLARNA